MSRPHGIRVHTGDLVLKITGTIVAVVVSALALTTTLNALRLEQTSQDLLAARLHGIAREVRSVAHRGLDVGLTLRTMTSLPDVLREYAAADPRISSITVHDCSGAVIAQAPVGRASGGATPWTRHPGATEWRDLDAPRAGLGLQILNSFGECAGGVAVAYDRESQTATLNEAVGTLIFNGLLAALAAVPAAVVTSRLLARRRRGLMAMFDDMAALEGADKDAASFPATEHDLSGGDVAAAYWSARPVLGEALKGTGADRNAGKANAEDGKASRPGETEAAP